jgi:hypothetical protein
LHRCCRQVLLRLRQLQEVLGLPSIAVAAATMIKQPNLMARRPDTLRCALFTAAVR